MGIDVKAQVVIRRSRDHVARYAMDPANDPVWISGITEARMLTEPPLTEGTRVERVATFMGKRIEYVLEVIDHDAKALLGMRSVKGPFPMKVTYELEEMEDRTLAKIRVQGEAGGFYKLAGPVMSRAVKQNITNDLKTLRDLMESEAAPLSTSRGDMSASPISVRRRPIPEEGQGRRVR